MGRSSSRSLSRRRRSRRSPSIQRPSEGARGGHATRDSRRSRSRSGGCTKAVRPSRSGSRNRYSAAASHRHRYHEDRRDRDRGRNRGRERLGGRERDRDRDRDRIRIRHSSMRRRRSTSGSGSRGHGHDRHADKTRNRNISRDRGRDKSVDSNGSPYRSWRRRRSRSRDIRRSPSPPRVHETPWNPRRTTPINRSTLPLLPPLPPTAGSGLVPGGPLHPHGSSPFVVHPMDPRAGEGIRGGNRWRGRSPPPSFFEERMQARQRLERERILKGQRKEQRRVTRQLMNQRKSVDHRSQPPFLLRIFYKVDDQHTLQQFQVRGGEPIEDELQVYAWMDSRLRDIAYLIKDVCWEARDRNAVWNFRLVYPDKTGKNALADLAVFHSIIPTPKEDSKTLEDVKFQIGDILLLSIIKKKKGMRLVPRPEPKLSVRDGWEVVAVDESEDKNVDKNNDDSMNTRNSNNMSINDTCDIRSRSTSVNREVNDNKNSDNISIMTVNDNNIDINNDNIDESIDNNNTSNDNISNDKDGKGNVDGESNEVEENRQDGAVRDNEDSSLRTGENRSAEVTVGEVVPYGIDDINNNANSEKTKRIGGDWETKGETGNEIWRSENGKNKDDRGGEQEREDVNNVGDRDVTVGQDHSDIRNSDDGSKRTNNTHSTNDNVDVTVAKTNHDKNNTEGNKSEGDSSAAMSKMQGREHPNTEKSENSDLDEESESGNERDVEIGQNKLEKKDKSMGEEKDRRIEVSEEKGENDKCGENNGKDDSNRNEAFTKRKDEYTPSNDNKNDDNKDIESENEKTNENVGKNPMVAVGRDGDSCTSVRRKGRKNIEETDVKPRRSARLHK